MIKQKKNIFAKLQVIMRPKAESWFEESVRSVSECVRVTWSSAKKIFYEREPSWRRDAGHRIMSSSTSTSSSSLVASLWTKKREPKFNSRPPLVPPPPPFEHEHLCHFLLHDRNSLSHAAYPLHPLSLPLSLSLSQWQFLVSWPQDY